MKMKTISLKQPWANLVACGKKTIETRKWKTDYRGDFVICSSKKPNIYPAGYALCIVELYDIRPMRKTDQKVVCIKIYPGAFSWFLRNLRRIKPPISVKGSLGTFDLKLPKNLHYDIL